MMHQRIMRSGAKDIGVESLLNWAFGAQQITLETPLDVRPGSGGCGTEWVIYQRGAVLGTAIDGGKGYLPDPVHDDAEIVAAIVKGALEWRVACWVADLARAGIRPDWMPGAVPRCVPRDLGRPNQHGISAKSEVATCAKWPDSWGGTVRTKGKNGQTVYHEVRVCPVKYEPTQAWINHQREAYRTWWAALHQVREHLMLSNLLSHRVTLEMPPFEPWRAVDFKSLS